MLEKIPENLRKLASACQLPLYIIGGAVRDHLLGYPVDERSDWDICSPMTEEELIRAAEKSGFTVCAAYKTTGTVKLKDEQGFGYEFARFRSDKYVRGMHAPAEITFTTDVAVDARRRDFCANAVYFDVKEGKFLDPLGGREDIRKRILRTVAPAEKVFGEDGLRLMRLCRFGAELGLSPDEECLSGAKKNARLIRDIVPERIFAELNAILHADLKHGIPNAPYHGLRLLLQSGVLEHILPDLYLGHGMEQRKDFHAYDVLEHTFRCVSYAPPEIRFAALFHDVGKPLCMKRDGNFFQHPEEGAKLTREIMSALRAPKKLTEETARLVSLHMKDYDCKTRVNKVKRVMVDNSDLLDQLFALKQADFSACKGDLSPAPTVVRWKKILSDTRKENAPLCLKQLAVDGNDLLAAGIPQKQIGTILKELLYFAAEDGSRNRKEILLSRAERSKKEIL